MSISLLAKHLNEQLSGKKMVHTIIRPSEPTYPVPTRWDFSSSVGKTTCCVHTNEEFCRKSKTVSNLEDLEKNDV